MSDTELQERVSIFLTSYIDGPAAYQSMREELLFVCGSLRSICLWASQFVSAVSLDAQEEMFFTDFYPIIQRHKFPIPGTVNFQDALHAFKMAAIDKQTIFGTHDAKPRA